MLLLCIGCADNKADHKANIVQICSLCDGNIQLRNHVYKFCGLKCYQSVCLH